MKYRKWRNTKQRRDREGLLLLTLLFLFLFPFIVSNFSGIEKQDLKTAEDENGQIWVLQRKFWGAVRIPLEEYLEGMLSATIPSEYHEETLKAQAILLRTYCIHNIEKKDGDKVIWDDNLKDLYFSIQEREKFWGETYIEKNEKIAEVVKETKGMIVVCDETIPELPFCQISSGQTRNIEEYVVHKEAFHYMKTAVCQEDIMAENYVQYVEVPIKEFQKKVKKILGEKNIILEKITLYRDSADYVKEVQVGENVIDGENFKTVFDLASSCFYLERINDRIQIKTKGLGHGFGFSQYSANKLAEEGKNYEYLLNYFFQNIELEKI